MNKVKCYMKFDVGPTESGNYHFHLLSLIVGDKCFGVYFLCFWISFYWGDEVQ